MLSRADGVGQVLAVEVMWHTSAAEECIVNPEKTVGIVKLIEDARPMDGMQSFDRSLMHLHRKGLITVEVAMSAATSPMILERNLTFT